MRTTARLRVAGLAFASAVALFAICFLAFPAKTAHAQFISPGPLTKCHTDLEGDSHCNDCHSGGKKVDDGKCIACHDGIKKEIDAKRGYHGATLAGKECSPCHVEHIGLNARLVRWPNADETKFDHAQSGWTLTGKHAETKCTDCHKGVTKIGFTTYLGLTSSCGSCHKDPHQGRLGQACEKCHDTTDFKKVALDRTFDHSRTRFPLLGQHATVSCEKCHGAPPDAKYTGIAFGACSDCHKDPHNGKFKDPCATCHTVKGWHEVSLAKGEHPVLSLANGHAKVACAKCHDKGNDKPPTKGSTCVSCHANVHAAPFGDDCKSCHAEILWMGIARDISLEAHAKTSYPLKGKHVDVDCAKCHDKTKPEGPRYRQVAFDKCTRCHADQHKGEFLARGGGECAQCHVEDGFAPAKFGAADHASTGFALEGKHQAVACRECHPGASPRLVWNAAKKTCAECHPNPHGDQFATEMAAGGCAHCHTALGWDQVKFDHSTFPLVGAHARTRCDSCHAATAEDKKSGKGASFKGVPRECEGCHDDVHGGQFRTEPQQKKCGDCHDPAADSFKLPQFDHAAKTGFVLDGKHAPLACGECHKTERRKDGVMSVRWRLGYRQCRDCHPNPHT